MVDLRVRDEECLQTQTNPATATYPINICNAPWRMGMWHQSMYWYAGSVRNSGKSRLVISSWKILAALPKAPES
jgi:hypothetical protein